MSTLEQLALLIVGLFISGVYLIIKHLQIKIGQLEKRAFDDKMANMRKEAEDYANNKPLQDLVDDNNQRASSTIKSRSNKGR